MPSPTSRTRPTSRVSSWVLYCWISSTSTETISSALNLMAAHLPHLFAQIDKLCPHRAVEDPVADADNHAAQQVRLYLLLEDWFQSEGLAEVVLKALLLVLRQGHSTLHQDAEMPPPQVRQVPDFLVDDAKEHQPVVVIEHQQEVHQQGMAPALKG